MKGQGSIEYMSIVAAIFVIFATVTHSQMVNPARETARNTEELAMARAACDGIADAINRVYYPEGSRTTEFVEFAGVGDLEINEDNVQISVFYDENKIWVESSLEYGFENSLSDVPNGSYAIIAEWDTSKPEGMWHIRENDEILINIRPGGE